MQNRRRWRAKSFKQKRQTFTLNTQSSLSQKNSFTWTGLASRWSSEKSLNSHGVFSWVFHLSHKGRKAWNPWGKPPFLTWYVPLLPVCVFNKDTFPTFYADGPLFHRSIYTSCTARPNQGPSNWVVKGAAGGDVRFITRYAQKSMHPLKWLSLYGPSGKYEWKWRSGRAFMWYEWGPPFRVLPHGSKQTSSRRVPLVLNSPCSQSIVCSHARFRTWLLDIKSPQKES